MPISQSRLHLAIGQLRQLFDLKTTTQNTITQLVENDIPTINSIISHTNDQPTISALEQIRSDILNLLDIYRTFGQNNNSENIFANITLEESHFKKTAAINEKHRNRQRQSRISEGKPQRSKFDDYNDIAPALYTSAPSYTPSPDALRVTPLSNEQYLALKAKVEQTSTGGNYEQERQARRAAVLAAETANLAPSPASTTVATIGEDGTIRHLPTLDELNTIPIKPGDSVF